MAIYVFDKEDWLEAYPQFKGLVTDAQLDYAFKIAETLLDNTESSPVPYDPENGIVTREILFYMLICHLVTLALRPINQAGPTSNATEGSVTVGFQIPTSVNGQYFMQTPCGQSYWQSIRKYIVGGRYYDQKHFHPWG